jgi:hypothetical protein
VVNYYFLFGATTNYGSFTATNLLSGSPGVVRMGVHVNGLSPGALYHYGVVASSTGGTSSGRDATFTTPAVQPVQFTGTLSAPGGNMMLSLTSVSGASFTVLSANDLNLPLSQWTSLGAMTETLPGQYQFTDPQSCTHGQCYYLIRSP